VDGSGRRDIFVSFVEAVGRCAEENDGPHCTAKPEVTKNGARNKNRSGEKKRGSHPDILSAARARLHTYCITTAQRVRRGQGSARESPHPPRTRLKRGLIKKCLELIDAAQA
jgi:hypothetical protein